MEFKSPLSQRIIISIVLLTTLVSGLFVVGIMFTIDMVEESLVTSEMQLLFPKVITSYHNHRPLELDKLTQFYASDQQLPEYLRAATPGFTEIVLGHQAFYAYRFDEGGASYYLVRDQSDFEKWENRLETTAVCGFVACVVVSFFLGLLMVKKIIAPVRRLTFQVRDRDKLINGTPPLASDYPDDEVGTLAKAFDSTLAMLHQALQREALFTSDVSHELRTPLMVIKSSCDVLIAKNDVDAFTRQKVGVIAKAVGEMQELIESFLLLARRKDAPLDMAALHKIVRDEQKNWEESAREKQLAFVISNAGCPEGLEHLYPRGLLRTVLNNLVRNAIYHTRQGGITLLLTAQGFELRDTGPGVAESDKAKVFQLFYRGEDTHPASMGLGLSLVQRICEREQWQFSLEDNQPQGCRFIVTLR